jgi:hypothetical protein
MRSPNPKEFHEMQWDLDYGARGRLVEERELPIASPDRPGETLPQDTLDTLIGPAGRSQRRRHSLSSIGIIEKIIEKLTKQKKEPQGEQKRRSWVPSALVSDSTSLFRDKRAEYDTTTIPLPEGCQIPNAIFARKFLIVNNGETLPSHLPISQMPTAETKATETIVEAATTGLLSQASPWLFRGPFTPQLGFDGGLDYQWNSEDPGITFRRFDLEPLLPEASETDLDCSSRRARFPGYGSDIQNQQSLSKRRGRVFDGESDAEMESHGLVSLSPDAKSSCGTKNDRLPGNSPIATPYTPTKSVKAAEKVFNISNPSTRKRSITVFFR